jgi:hypothetical protein
MDQKQALADRLKQANNILVTVSNNPSVDQLAACIGLTLALNKLDKHATAVFSGAVPNIIEFLEPEKTIEKNTDSLRDFIIALDKSKADKLRYKVEDKVVKIFITPYKTSINEKDLEFSQGDFNVDVVLALGVHNQADLDQAITSHGRILHDATVATVNTEPGGELGTLNWVDHDASSLSELAAELVDAIDKKTMDTQISTALLTGIVAETERFSNNKTSPMTMTISAELMGAGANQQLVATKLEPPAPEPKPAQTAPQEPADSTNHDEAPAQPASKSDDGTLEISHVGEPEAEHEPEHKSEQPEDKPEPAAEEKPAVKDIFEEVAKPEQPEEDPELAQLKQAQRVPKWETEHESIPELEQPESTRSPDVPQIKIDEHGSLEMHDGQESDQTIHKEKQHMILEPPILGGQMSGSMLSEEERPAGDPAPAILSPGLLQRGSSTASTSFPPAAPPFSPPQLPITSSTPPSPFPPVATTAPILEPPAPVLPPQPTPSMAVPPPLQPPDAFQSAPAMPPPSPAPFAPPPAVSTPAPPSQTLSEIEQNVNSPHLQQFMSPQPSAPPPSFSVVPATPSFVPPAPPQPLAPPMSPLPTPIPNNTPSFMPPPSPVSSQETTVAQQEAEAAAAREAVMHAYDGTERNEPIEALNAQPLGAPLHEAPAPEQSGQQAPPSIPPPIVPPTLSPGV